MSDSLVVRKAPSRHQLEINFTETLPLRLFSVLERRYLSDFAVGNWHIQSRDGDNAHPLLRQVVGLGRPQQPGQWARAMPHVLTSCHDPGHALMMMLHGTGECHRFYLGARRIIGAGARSTEDYLLAQESAFKAHISGLELGAASKLSIHDSPDAASFLRTAPAMAVITGIPSRRGAQGFEFQSLDRLVKAVGNRRYILMIVAEPLEPILIDRTLDACRHLKSEVHAYIRRSISRSQSTSKSISHTEEEERARSWTDQLPFYLYGLAAFSNLALAPQVAAKISGALQTGGMMLFYQGNQEGKNKSQQITEGESESESGSVELLNANAEACEQLLQKYIDRLQSARTGGWWQTAIYIVADSDASLYSVSGALRSLCGGEATALDPIRMIPLPEHLRSNVELGQILKLIPNAERTSHPLGESYETLGTCLNSDELSVVVNLPQQEIPSLPMRDQSEFALSVPPPTEDSIHIGTLTDGTGRDFGPVTITSNSLNRHLFVTGITGSGKTNTCMNILLETYQKFGLPFLVLEPAKREYRRLAQTPELKGKLRIYSVGGGASLPFRLNPLRPVPGIPIARHIDLLKAVFNASFPMFAGMPYVLEDALIEVYKERGWNLYDSKNLHLERLGRKPRFDELSALTPNLQDLHDKIETVLEKKRYGQEIHRNMGAALRARLGSLMRGSKGLMLNTRRSINLEHIFGAPTIIELKELEDDEEKAFMMALLFIMLYEYAEVRQDELPEHKREKLQHLTLVEEAHRLLQATRGPASPEVGDPRAKAVSMFTDMLAEMRAYGEGFIIADQIPTKLAPETLKNSNLKIVHRLVSPDDRRAAGECINLNEWQTRHLNNLHQGLAIVHDERIGEAVLTRIRHVKDTQAPNISEIQFRALIKAVKDSDAKYLYRHAGCSSCPSPCDFYNQLETVESPENLAAQLRPFFDSLLARDPERAWNAWSHWRSNDSSFLHSDANYRNGLSYCGVTQAAYQWLGEVLTSRNKIMGHNGQMSPLNRLQREAAAQALGTLIINWIGKKYPDEEAQQVFREASEKLKDAIASAPPQEMPGCEKCSVRCEMLSFVSPHLSELSKKIAPILRGNQSTELRLSLIERSVAQIEQDAAIVSHDTSNAHRDWLHCVLTNIEFPANAANARTELLDLLRQSRPDADHAELGGIFGV